MIWLTWFAIYFILWWVTLFAVLPFSLRTQEEDGDVVLGTTASAPGGSHVRRAALRTTIVSAIIMALYLLATEVLGVSFDSIPRIVPHFDA